jgi:putative ABC transport system permease protein
MFNIPLAWLQLARQRTRFLVALAGIAFVVVLMLMQLGFRDALYSSATQLHQSLQGDLFIISSQYKSLTSNQSFPRNRLYQALSFDEVESVNPLYFEFAKLKNPIDGRKFPIYVIGFDPAKIIFKLPEVTENINVLKLPNYVLFDRASRPEFGPIASEFVQKESVNVEVFSYYGLVGYRVKVGGLFSLGPSFGLDGNLIVSTSTFLRIFQDSSVEKIDVGLINLKPGADPEKVSATLSSYLPEDVKILTRKDFIEFEKNYWTVRTPIGFVFNMMLIMGFVVGIIVVYQILYSNISNHLAQYATLKAMGFRNKYLLSVVFQQALLLASLGYIPGLIISMLLYDVAKDATKLPVLMSLDKGLTVLICTIFMCLISGFFSTNKLRAVDPADIF